MRKMTEASDFEANDRKKEAEPPKSHGLWRRLVFSGLWVLLVSLPLSFLWSFLFNRPSDRVVAEWQQTEDIQYQSFDPYTLSVIEGERKWSGLGGPVRRYYIFIGRGTEAPAYGHYKDYSFTPGGEDVDCYIARSRVEWSEEGVTFIEPSGHRLFIPKKMFIGGR